MALDGARHTPYGLKFLNCLASLLQYNLFIYLIFKAY